MILNPSEIQKIIHNVLDASFDENGFLHFHRFSEKQREAYAQVSADWATKARTSASATFDFITDSGYLTLKIDLYPGSGRSGSLAQKYGSIDLYVDGVFFATRMADDLSVKLAGFPLPEGEHRVTVYFPWSTETVVREVQISEGASVIPVEKSCKMMCFGDSITQGYATKFTSLSYVNQTAKILNAEVVNQGIGGCVFNEDLIDKSIICYKPDIITVAYGTNDYSRYETAEAFAEPSGKYIRKLAKLFPDTPIVGILPIYRNDQNHNMRTLYRTYSLDDARKLLKGYYEALPNGYILEQTGIAHLPQFYVEDFLHPNEFGFTLMAQEIAHKLKAILNK